MTEQVMPVLLDGSYGEGAGALMRTALSLSALTQRPLRVENVRGGSAFPGLAAEDLSLIHALKVMTAAETIHAEMNSHQLSFMPTRAGSGIQETLPVPSGDNHQNACILAATLLPVLARTGKYSTLRIMGQTHGHNALSYDAFVHQTVAALKKFGLYAFPDLVAGGFGRASNGQIDLEVEPSSLTGVQWRDRGELKTVRAIITAAKLPEGIIERGASHLERMAHNVGLDVEIEIVTPASETRGISVSVLGEFEFAFGSGASHGARGLRIESVAQIAFSKFMSWYKTDATVDEYLADQILLTACLSEGSSFFRVNKITQRLITTVWVIKQFIPISIVVKGHEGEAGSVSVKK